MYRKIVFKNTLNLFKHNLEIKLASDEDGKLCEMFGVWVEKSMYGKKYMGIERSTFLFDEKLSWFMLGKSKSKKSC